MSEEFGSDFISVSDEDGNEFELELLDAWELNGTFYHAFAPANSNMDSDEELDIVILKSVEVDGEEMLSTTDSEEELNEAYEVFLKRLYDEEDTED